MVISDTNNFSINKIAEQNNTEKTQDIKIPGIVSNLNNDGKQYYVATDNENYYLFAGQQCINPNLFYDFDTMWDDYNM